MTVMIESTTKSISKTIEFFCGQRLTPREGDILNYCQTLGEVFVGFVDEKFICCWGLIPPSFLSTQAYLWMWAPEPIKHQFVFVRHSQLQIEKMLERYESIVGHCYCNAKSAQRWLRWLGAEFGEAADGKVPFVIRKANG